MNQSPDTYQVMRVITYARLQHGITLDDMAQRIEQRGHRITTYEYKAIENGLTKRVPLDLVIILARILDLSANDLFHEVLP